jgi:hypothetical protein
MLVSLPHALEDFQYGGLARLGVNLALGIAILVVMYSLQLSALTFVVSGSSRAALLLAITGAIWCIGATLIHGHDIIFAGPSYRHGTFSKLLEVMIIVLGALVAFVGVCVAYARSAGHHVQQPKTH